MTFRKEDFTTVLVRAKELVPGFRAAYSLFEERVVLDRLSKSLATNYGRNVAHLALHFMRLPHEVSVEEVNSYLYRKSVHEGFSESYFKQTVFGMKFWYRLFGKEEHALKMPFAFDQKGEEASGSVVETGVQAAVQSAPYA